MSTKNSILKKKNEATGLAWESKKQAAGRQLCREIGVGAPRRHMRLESVAELQSGLPFLLRRSTRHPRFLARRLASGQSGEGV